jgi:membrane-associated phospholipid phosphatase
MHSPTLRSPPRDGTPIRWPLWTAALCGLLSIALLVMVTVRWSPLISVDRAVAVDLHHSAVHHPGWTHANRVLTDWVWDPWTMRALMVLAAVVLLSRGERLVALVVLAAPLIGAAVQQGMKAAVARPRPHWRHPVDTAHYAAFPSGHALTAALALCLLGWLLLRGDAHHWWRAVVIAVAVVSVVGVGFTRLYLGVHWLSDVLAGWLLGAAMAAVAAGVCIRWREPRPSGKAPVPGAE